jgi:hypothetical protein
MFLFLLVVEMSIWCSMTVRSKALDWRYIKECYQMFLLQLAELVGSSIAIQ